ncbi:hypothetical protein N431DRAFT_66497 [Stipitochalara longipes BDJ]|nr:hypothetical protein N431DRAFT_66497 [Stipitochalara longipes BDJ]
MQYQQFEQYLQKYDKGLSSNAQANTITIVAKKIKWTLKELKGKVDSLKSAATGPILSINLLLALQCRIDISVIADELTKSSTQTTMSDLDQKFRALDNRIGLILNAHEQLKEDISQEQAMLRDEVNHWLSKTSVQFNELSSVAAATSSPLATINDKMVLEAFDAINRHLENLERSGSIAQNTCSVLKKTIEQKLKKLEEVEVFLARAQEVEKMQESRHEELQALSLRTGKLTVVDALQIAGTVVGLFSFFTSKSTMLRAVKEGGNLDLTPTMFSLTRVPTNGNGHETWARDDGSTSLASYPFELAPSHYFWEDQELNSKLAKTPFQIRRMLHYLVDHTSTWGPKRSFLPVAQLHPDVLQADVHLHLCQLVSIIRRENHQGGEQYVIWSTRPLTEAQVETLKWDSIRWTEYQSQSTKKIPYVESEMFKARWLNLRETTHYKIEADRMIVQQEQLEADEKAAKEAAKEAAKQAEEKRLRDEEEARRKAFQERMALWRKEYEENGNSNLYSNRRIDRWERIENARWARQMETERMRLDELREEAERQRVSSYSDARVQREDWDITTSKIQGKPIRSKLELWEEKKAENLVLLEAQTEAMAKAKAKHD